MIFSLLLSTAGAVTLPCMFSHVVETEGAEARPESRFALTFRNDRLRARLAEYMVRDKKVSQIAEYVWRDGRLLQERTQEPFGEFTVTLYERDEHGRVIALNHQPAGRNNWERTTYSYEGEVVEEPPNAFAWAHGWFDSVPGASERAMFATAPFDGVATATLHNCTPRGCLAARTSKLTYDQGKLVALEELKGEAPIRKVVASHNASGLATWKTERFGRGGATLIEEHVWTYDEGRLVSMKTTLRDPSGKRPSGTMTTEWQWEGDAPSKLLEDGVVTGVWNTCD